jgi:hypothetical protein
MLAPRRAGWDAVFMIRRTFNEQRIDSNKLNVLN